MRFECYNKILGLTGVQVSSIFEICDYFLNELLPQYKRIVRVIERQNFRAGFTKRIDFDKREVQFRRLIDDAKPRMSGFDSTDYNNEYKPMAELLVISMTYFETVIDAEVNLTSRLHRMANGEGYASTEFNKDLLILDRLKGLLFGSVRRLNTIYLAEHHTSINRYRNWLAIFRQKTPHDPNMLRL